MNVNKIQHTGFEFRGIKEPYPANVGAWESNPLVRLSPEHQLFAHAHCVYRRHNHVPLTNIWWPTILLPNVDNRLRN